MNEYGVIMFANLLHFLNRRRTAEDYDLAFIRGVDVQRPPGARSRRSEMVLLAGWVLIVAKCWGVWWLIEKYQMPVDPWWIIAPTIGAAAVCTWLYLRRP